MDESGPALWSWKVIATHVFEQAEASWRDLLELTFRIGESEHSAGEGFDRLQRVQTADVKRLAAIPRVRSYVEQQRHRNGIRILQLMLFGRALLSVTSSVLKCRLDQRYLAISGKR